VASHPRAADLEAKRAESSSRLIDEIDDDASAAGRTRRKIPCHGHAAIMFVGLGRSEESVSAELELAALLST
jgi:hypothetical protein